MTNKIKASNLDTNAVTADAISYPLTTFSSTGIDDNASSTTITIDSSGNVSVGTTETPGTVATTSSVEGLGYQANDYLAISRAGTSEQGNLILNKLTNDGDIIVLNKNGTRVGSIDVSSTGMGLYLGGTASANKLDDYEEGTWTPGVVGFTTSSSEGYYRKVGSQVTVWFKYTSTTNLSSSFAYDITGLPFTPTHYGGTFGLLKFVTTTLGRGLTVSLNSYETTKLRAQIFNFNGTTADASYDDSLTGMATFFIN